MKEFSFAHQKKYIDLFLEMSKGNYANYKTYLEYIVVYIMWWRLRCTFSGLADSDYKAKITNLVESTIDSVDAGVINSKIFSNSEHRIFSLKRKYGKEYADNSTVTTLEEQGFTVISEKNLFIKTIKLKNDRLYVEGRLAFFLPGEKYDFVLKSGNEEYSVYWDCGISEYIRCLDKEIVLQRRGFYAFIPFEKANGLKGALTADGKEYHLGMRKEKATKLGDDVCYVEDNELRIEDRESYERRLEDEEEL